MTQFELHKVKDLGQQREVMEALPYAVVGGTWEGSFQTALAQQPAYATLLSHIVPHGQQLKILFLRIWSQNSNGAIFSIVETNPAAAGLTGTVEAYPVVGSVPSGVRDYPMLEQAGAEVLHGSLKDPIHVLEGSIDFRLFGPITPDGSKYGLVWWGVQKDPE